ncbi:MAG: antitoxin [Deltaproteobacteria bacterium RBG_16_54_11]|nr:MAG: antitoxin [Deltaproteobacteria bacterium RBG_16_54_11]
MAILQVRDIDDRLYASLKKLAHSENRSLSQEVISILEKYLSNPALFKNNPTREFLSLSTSWEDDRTADEIIADIKKNRRNSKRFGVEHVVFD